MFQVLSVVIASMMLLAAPHSFAESIEENDTVYLEVKKPISIFSPVVLNSGERALTTSLVLPEESIISVGVLVFQKTLEYSRTEPNRLKFPYIPYGKNRTEVPSVGWMCGLRIVDIPDEDLRDQDDLDQADYCISLADLKHVTSLASNGADVKESLKLYSEKKDLHLLSALAEKVRELRLRQNEFSVEQVSGQSMISPLENCSMGCLVATSEYGMRRHPVLRRKRMHKGIDLRAAIGSHVVSVLPGKVLANRTEKKGKKMKGYGHYVIVIHPEARIETRYAHLSGFKAEAGQKVEQGQLIALSGNTGIGTAPHLHFETHIPGKRGYVPSNPRAFIGNFLDVLASIVEFFSLKV